MPEPDRAACPMQPKGIGGEGRTSVETAAIGASQARAYTDRIPFVIAASAAGTAIEWYDFYLYGVLATFFSTQFFPTGDPTAALLSSLATFGAGFAVRPFGAALFGRIGDIVGRKFTFLVTITLMGISTAAVGLLPTFAQIGYLAPLLLLILRLVQGLALGGEYGGAAIYVAEHSPDDRRGSYTSWIQTTATIGLLLALTVIGVVRVSMGDAAFKDVGWRLPFLLSAVLVALALYVRLRLRETPLFSRLKDAGKSSTAPWRESFGNPANRRLILLALLGMTAGQAVVWYQGQFQALFFLQNTLQIPFRDSYLITALGIALATPFFVVFGRLSDRVGRKKIILGGCVLAAITYVPIYIAMSNFAGPASAATDAAGKAITVHLAPNVPVETALVFIQVLYVTMVYGPIAAFLVEFFPARIRYTSMSIPYHIGNGWFGGFLPLIFTAVAAATGNIYAGLAYPIGVALLTAVIGWKYIRETYHVRIWDEVGGEQPGRGLPAGEWQGAPTGGGLAG
jgi:MFS family permease